jgi:hydrogenase-4 component E
MQGTPGHMGFGVLSYDVAHLLGGAVLVLSFGLLYQRRVTAVINLYAMQGVVLACAAGWQAWVQAAPHLFVTALIALIAKGVLMPIGLHRIVREIGVRGGVEAALGIFPTMVMGVGLVALSILVVLPTTLRSAALTREDLAFALSVVLLGLLMMITRRTALTQVIGFMSLENGLVLAATGAKGMPLVVEISIAFSILIAFIVIGIFLFRIRERFDTVDVQALDRFRGERR